MIAYSAVITTTRANALQTALQAGGANASLRIYTAPIPAAGATIVSTLMLTFVLPPGIAASDGLTITGIESGLVSASGIPKWGRITDSLGTWIADVDVGDQNANKAVTILVDAGSSGEVQMYAGAIVTLTRLKLA